MEVLKKAARLSQGRLQEAEAAGLREALKKMARLGQLLMGLVFLLAGGIKVWEPVLFFWDVVPQVGLLGLGAWARGLAELAMLLGPLECGLGLALVLNWRGRLILPLATGLMAFFTVLAGLAFYYGGGNNCGCFGTLLERTPGQALAEDLVMLGLLVGAWWARRGRVESGWGPRRWVVLGGTVLAMGVAGARVLPNTDRLQDSDLRVGVRLTGLQLKGVEIDLMRGDYLVEWFNPKCAHCMREVPRLNGWARTEGLPLLVGLNTFAQDSAELKEFKERLQPLYPIATISNTDYLRFTAGHGYPRLALVRDGVVQAVWEHHQLPSVEELKKAVGA